MDVAKEAATSWSSHRTRGRAQPSHLLGVFLGSIIVIAIAIAGLFVGHDAVTSQVTPP